MCYCIVLMVTVLVRTSVFARGAWGRVSKLEFTFITALASGRGSSKRLRYGYVTVWVRVRVRVRVVAAPASQTAMRGLMVVSSA